MVYFPLAQLSPGRHHGKQSTRCLPFENLSSDKETRFFTDGVKDEIFDRPFEKIADLKWSPHERDAVQEWVPPRNLREIGRNSACPKQFVEGSVQRGGQQMRVIAQVNRFPPRRLILGPTYARDLADVCSSIQRPRSPGDCRQFLGRPKLSPNEKKAIERRPPLIWRLSTFTAGRVIVLTASFSATTGQTC